MILTHTHIYIYIYIYIIHRLHGELSSSSLPIYTYMIKIHTSVRIEADTVFCSNWILKPRAYDCRSNCQIVFSATRQESSSRYSSSSCCILAPSAAAAARCHDYRVLSRILVGNFIFHHYSFPNREWWAIFSVRPRTCLIQLSGFHYSRVNEVLHSLAENRPPLVLHLISCTSLLINNWLFRMNFLNIFMPPTDLLTYTFASEL